MTRVLAVVAHADDEVLGVGATLATHAAAGDDVHVVFTSDCRTVRHEGSTPGLSEEAVQSVAALGIKNAPRFLGYKGMTLHTHECTELALNRRVGNVINQLLPEVVYTHHLGDINTDHRAVAQAVMVACRPIGMRPRRLLSFETPSSSEWGYEPFNPNVFVDVSAFIHLKEKAILIYKEEVRQPPHPRSPSCLVDRAAYWGQLAGFRYAEPFILIREVQP